MSDTLAYISLQLNQLTRYRKTDTMRERVEEGFVACVAGRDSAGENNDHELASLL